MYGEKEVQDVWGGVISVLRFFILPKYSILHTKTQFFKKAIPRKLLLQDKVSMVACGLNHTCFLTLKNELFTVGSNEHRQLGIGDVNLSIPHNVFYSIQPLQ